MIMRLRKIWEYFIRHNRLKLGGSEGGTSSEAFPYLHSYLHLHFF